MKHIPSEALLHAATEVSADVIQMSRRQRLLRWADLLMQAPNRRLTALPSFESFDPAVRPGLRAANSPISVAFADPTLRLAGLKGDSLGHAESFFGFNGRQSHRLLCRCKYYEPMTGRAVARRLMLLANPSRWRRIIGEFFA